MNVPLITFLVIHILLLMAVCLGAWSSWKKVKYCRKQTNNGVNWFDNLHRAEVIFYRNRATAVAALCGEIITMALLYMAGVFDLLF